MENTWGIFETNIEEILKIFPQALFFFRTRNSLTKSPLGKFFPLVLMVFFRTINEKILGVFFLTIPPTPKILKIKNIFGKRIFLFKAFSGWPEKRGQINPYFPKQCF